MGATADVVAYLTTEGLAGGSTGWDLVARRLADTPMRDAAVVVGEDGGAQPEIAAPAGIGDSAMGDAGVLVTVRAAQWKSNDSFAKAAEILVALHGLLDVMVGSTQYLRVVALTSEPVFAGFDEQGRPLHTVAFRLLAER